MPNNQASMAPMPIPTGDAPDCKLGRRAVHVIIDFTLGNPFALNMQDIQQRGQFDSAQTLYVDNINGTGALRITMGLTLQEIDVPAGAQGYFPILQGNPPNMVVQALAGTPIVNIQVLNFFMPPMVWYPNGISVIDVTLAGIIVNGQVPVLSNPATNTLTNVSGTIAAGGTGQVLLGANVARKRLIIQNPSTATEVLQWSPFFLAGPYFDLAAGQAYDSDGSTIEGNAVWIKAATTGHAFTAGWA